MKHLASTAAALALTATAATSGGIDRSGQSVSILFEPGNYAEFSLGIVNPSVSGTAIALPAPGFNGAGSGDMAVNYLSFSGSYKQQFTDGLSGAVIFDQPFGANVDYPAGTAYYARGSTAELNSTAITGIVKYTTPSHISLYGGLRYQTMAAKAFIPFVTLTPGVTAAYTANGATDGGLGYLIGAAYEKPEIALRVALTYNSEIKHVLTTTETSFLGTAPPSATNITTPQSLSLDIQSGIAANTLLFGSIRWVEWSKFDITPRVYNALTSGSLVSYDADTISYTLGLGRKFSENWSGAVTVGYEGKTGGFSSNLGPTDGYWSIGLGGTYTKDRVKITAGLRYVGIGDAQVRVGSVAPSANFASNRALAAGIRIGISF